MAYRHTNYALCGCVDVYSQNRTTKSIASSIHWFGRDVEYIRIILNFMLNDLQAIVCLDTILEQPEAIVEFHRSRSVALEC